MYYIKKKKKETISEGLGSKDENRSLLTVVESRNGGRIRDEIMTLFLHVHKEKSFQ
jgi:hypothetical protein